MFALLRQGLLLLFVSTSAALAASGGTLPLMPWPQQVSQPMDASPLKVDYRLSIAVEGDDLGTAIDRWRERIAKQTGWTLQPQPAIPKHPTIRIVIAKAVAPQPQPNSDERYRLVIDSHGVRINAETRFGAFHAMETVLQLLHLHGAEVATLPPVTIVDAPRFPWRGMLLDSVRHFLPVETIKRQIDGMAAAKLNVLHWHLVDDQGWRFQSQRYPQLTERASDGQFYTQSQMRDIVSYAAARGIRVVPEIDMPGHASALAVAMPELMSAPGPYVMERGWGVFTPLMDPTKAETWQFIETLLGEVATIFPDPWLHIGGDEVDDTQWVNSAAVQKFMREHEFKNSHDVQAYFNLRVEEILAKYQRRMIGWDEIAHPSLPRSILIQSWQGQDALGKVVKENYQGMLSTGYYLDQPQPSNYHYRNDPLPRGLEHVDQVKEGERGQSWQFILPRLKGNPVTGSFTLIDGKGGWRGFIDFDGKSRRSVQAVKWLSPNQITFTVDTWMGPLRTIMTLVGEKMSGYMFVGNVRYTAKGHRLSGPPAGILPTMPDAEQQKNVLGGEMALWSENVTSQIIDTKLWPRAFVVAERLWSAQDITDEANMYQRLTAIDAWSSISAGVQPHQQRMLHMMRLANSTEVQPLMTLAEVLEPAQYYTRQHLKFQAGHYHQFEPLNRLVDVLPSESEKVRQLNVLVERLMANRGDKDAAVQIRQQLLHWQQTLPTAAPLLQQNPQLQPLTPVLNETIELCHIGLALINAIEKNQFFGAREMTRMHDQLVKAATLKDEMIIALVRPIEKLLHFSK